MSLKLWAALAAALLAPGAMRVADFSSDLNDYNPSFDRAERLVVFARSEAEFARARIMTSEKRRGRWSVPAPIAFTDPRWSDTDPWLTPDGRTLYFISTRPSPARPQGGNLDIWRARRAGAGWSAPEHLGDRVNSAGPELGVELHGGLLTFASARRGGKGELDIYAARLGSGGFEDARALDGSFNSAASDSDFTLSPDGRTALFWRGTGGRGVLYLSRRTARGWSAPTPLPVGLNPGPFNFTPAFARDGRRIWFASTAPRSGQAEGMADIYTGVLPAR